MANTGIAFDFEPILKELELTLSGKTVDETTRTTRELKKDSRYMNDEGVLKCMSIIRAHMNMNTCLSNFDQEFINNKCSIIFEDIYKVLLINRSRYEIRSDADIELICHMIDTSAYAALMRAKAGAESLKFYKSTEQKIYMSPGNQQGGTSV